MLFGGFCQSGKGTGMSGRQDPIQMFAEERKQEIIKIIQQQKKIVVPQLCDYFGVSASTI